MAISWKQLGEDWLVEDPQLTSGWRDGELPEGKQNLIDYLQMQLAVSGLPVSTSSGPVGHKAMWQGALLSNRQEKNRLLSEHRPAVDQRIESFLQGYLGDAPFGESLHLPHSTLCLDRHGMQRTVSVTTVAPSPMSQMIMQS